MSPLLAFQLRRVARNRQYLFFTVLLPALFTIFFTKIFGGQAADAAQYQDAAGCLHGLDDGLRRDRRRPRRDHPDLVRPGVGMAAPAAGHARAADAGVRRRRRRRRRCSRCPSLVVVALVGRFVNDVQLGLGTWVALVGVLWAGSIAFVALGLLIGLRLDEKAAGGAIGFVGIVLAALGGLWVPVEIFPETLRAIAHGDAVLLVRRAGPGRGRRRRRRRRRRCSCWPASPRCSPSSRCSWRGGARCTPSPDERRLRSRPWTRGVAGGRLGWALPWLLFLAFPIADLIVTPRPGAGARRGRRRAGRVHGRLPRRVRPGVRAAAATPPRRIAGRRGRARGGARRSWLGTSWAGLLIYVSAAAAGSLPAAVGLAGGARRRRRLYRGRRRRRPARRRVHPAGDVPADRLRAAGHPAPDVGQRRARGGPRRAGPQRGRRRSGCASPATCTTCSATACR